VAGLDMAVPRSAARYGHIIRRALILQNATVGPKKWPKSK
jgi:hypothetical protein